MDLAVPALMLILLVVVLILAVRTIKRRTIESEDLGGTVWSLYDLTQLRDSGGLTIQQYEQLKAGVIADLHGTDAESTPAGKNQCDESCREGDG